MRLTRVLRTIPVGAPGLLRDLYLRGFVHNVSKPESLHAHLESAPRTLYVGIDPSATNLHLGHLFPIICVNHFIHAGHRVVPIIGGATGSIGDPSGRASSRNASDLAVVQDNVIQLSDNVSECYQKVRKFVQRRSSQPETGLPSSFKLVNNTIWWSKMSLLNFLNIVGANSKVNVMMTRDSVKSRLASQSGLLFSEFSYQLLQAYDFYHLFATEQCTLQIGGADQWGNIVEGLNLISRIENPEAEERTESYAYGLTTPLLTTSSGAKFGKSAGNAIWLNKELTTILDFYQYFLRLSDDDAKKYLPLFTFKSVEECAALVELHNSNQSERPIQRALAAEVTEMIHGADGLKHAKNATSIFFGNSTLEGLSTEEVLTAMEPTSQMFHVSPDELFGTPLIKLLAKNGIVTSISAARQLMSSGAIRVNKHPVRETNYSLTPASLHEGRLAAIKVGPSKHCVFVLL